MENLAFCIQDNSMAPMLAPNDVLICRPIPVWEEIQENEVYAIVTTNGSILVKRVDQIRRTSNSTIVQLRLRSDNEGQQRPIRLAKSNIKALFKLERKLSASA